VTRTEEFEERAADVGDAFTRAKLAAAAARFVTYFTRNALRGQAGETSSARLTRIDLHLRWCKQPHVRSYATLGPRRAIGYGASTRPFRVATLAGISFRAWRLTMSGTRILPMPWPSNWTATLRRDRVSARGSTVRSTVDRMGPCLSLLSVTLTGARDAVEDHFGIAGERSPPVDVELVAQRGQSDRVELVDAPGPLPGAD
jgi:hypothetical protein